MRVLIADDSVLLRQGLALILAEGGHEVVADVGDGQALVDRALELRPEIVIADIRMPPSHTDEGLRAAAAIRAQWPQAPILLLSQYVVAGYLPELMADGGGALGYLLKDRVSDIDSFLEAVERVARGELVLDPDVVAQVMQRGRRDDPVERLTPREREVLGLMAEGHTNAAIAARLVVTEGAVEKHTQRIFAKLGLLPDAAVHRRVKAVLTLLSS
ncbi:response regulator transcription factor [Actinomyces bowdenii]|uniref:DNA-binding response regulator n=1 Tax=Actinomyces bowdenii TaxID=131109 RepID=A0A3P1V361_9ACTO|nr:response regulator transcription factor [Actinomyces bowdenii]RRD28614.1 DNA-binding response regulator [Actinomyces bowdenii]